MLAPAADCSHCPRLCAYRAENARAEPAWHNAPVAAFGGADARLLIVGLAPGRGGANRTGRPFTGDYAGDLLYPTLEKFGFAQGRYGAAADDGLDLVGCRITNAVRCVPPQNKPIGAEFAACRRFLASEIGAMGQLRVILALGRGAHDQILRTLALRPAKSYPFGHGAWHAMPDARWLADSYHCSRYNTNTRRLSVPMFESVFAAIRERLLDGSFGAP